MGNSGSIHVGDGEEEEGDEQSLRRKIRALIIQTFWFFYCIFCIGCFTVLLLVTYIRSTQEIDPREAGIHHGIEELDDPGEENDDLIVQQDETEDVNDRGEEANDDQIIFPPEIETEIEEDVNNPGANLTGTENTNNQGNLTGTQHTNNDMVESETQLALKKLDEWWINTRSIMAMVAIMFVTLSLTVSFAPPATILNNKAAGIIFFLAANMCLIVSVAVLFLLFGVTSVVRKTERRTLKIAKFGLWICLFSVTIAYVTTMLVAIPDKGLRIYLAVSTSIAFFFSRNLRVKTRGSRILQESDEDRVNPYLLSDIFDGRENVEF